MDTVTRTAEEMDPTNFKELKLWERRDLQEWVKTSPGLIGEEVIFLSSEFAQFDKTNDRLDVLGIKRVTDEEGSRFGRLVVVELKRDTDRRQALQALHYAAFVSGFSANDVIPLLAQWEGVEEEEAGRKLAEFLGVESTNEIEIDSRPMIVLMAQRFRDETTTTVMWLLEELDLDISCVRLVSYEIGGELYVQTDKIIPLPEAEQYRMAKQEKEVAKKPGARRQGPNVLTALIENDVLADGDTLTFSQAKIPAGSKGDWSEDRPELKADLSTSGDFPSLIWSDPESGETGKYKISTLASMILALVKGEVWKGTSSGVQGVDYWEYEGKRLKALAAESGLTSGSIAKFRADDVRSVCLEIPRGRWTSYGAIARSLGSPNGAQSVSRIVAGFRDEDNPHRVLRKNGEISPDWGLTTGQSPQECRERLEVEGVLFNEAGRASLKDFWQPQIADAAEDYDE